MITLILNFLEVYISKYGYIIAFIFSFLENSIFLGLIFPGVTAIVLLGVYAHQGILNPFVLILCLIFGSVLGNNVGYFLGYKYGRALIKKIGKRFSFEEESFKYAEEFYEKNGPKAVIWGRMVAMVGLFIPFSAGISKMKYLKFLIFDIIGATLWSSTLVLLGYFFGASWERIASYIGEVGVVLLIITVYTVYKYIKKMIGNKK